MEWVNPLELNLFVFYGQNQIFTINFNKNTSLHLGSLKTATLVKDGAGLGFSLEGGKGSIQGDKPLTVKKIFIGMFAGPFSGWQ